MPDKPLMDDDPLRFFREYGLSKAVMDEIASHTSETAQDWVHDLLEAYRPHAKAEDAARARKPSKQSHTGHVLTPGREAILRNIARKHPEWPLSQQVRKVASEARKLAIGHPDGPPVDPDFAAYLQPPLPEEVMKKIRDMLKEAGLRKRKV